jgi:hypothetical protein
MRTSTSQLPQIEELLTIISQESKRRVPPEKVFLNLNLLDFKPLFELMDYVGIEYDKALFTDSAYEFLVGYKELENIKNKLVETLSSLPALASELLLKLEAIYSYLQEDDSAVIEQSSSSFELGFVFGSTTTIRMQKAIELYNQGKISKIMVSGHKPFYKESIRTEAEVLQEYALSQGVAHTDIIIETKALTIPDNVKRSLDLFEETDYFPESIVLITSPFNMRRAYTDWLKFCPVYYSPTIMRQCSSVSDTLSAKHWYKSENSLHIVLNEYFKNRGEHLIDVYLFNQ